MSDLNTPQSDQVAATEASLKARIKVLEGIANSLRDLVVQSAVTNWVTRGDVAAATNWEREARKVVSQAKLLLPQKDRGS